MDANGIDVTPSIDLDTRCIVSVSGAYTTAEIAEASKSTITMNNVGDKATVTVTYNSTEKDAADVVGTTEITCVAATAALGKTVFATHEDLSINSNIAKFYQDKADTVADVAVDGTKTIDFCAIDDNGDAISYDSYEIETANSNIANATLIKDSGKAATLTISATSVGKTQINITATKNGAASYYTIPVTTYEEGVATSMKVSIDKTLMSDANDADYYATIKAELFDAAGRKVDGHFVAEITTTTTTTTATATTTAGDKCISFENGSIVKSQSVDDGAFKIFANNANARNYTIRINGADNKNNSGKYFERNVSLNVKELKAPLTNIAYQVEVTTSNDNDKVADVSKKETVRTRLYATSNGLFAGYVDPLNFGEGFTLGGKAVAKGSRITAVTASAIYGNKTYEAKENSGLVEVTGSGLRLTTSAEKSLTYNTVVDGANKCTVDQIIDNRPNGEGEVAKLGSYTVKYIVQLDNDKAATPKTTTFSVMNSYKTPTVKVIGGNKADSLDTENVIKDKLVTNVDLNTDTDDNAIKDLVANNYSSLDVVNGKLVVRYAVVHDVIGRDKEKTGGTEWMFYVPVNTTFVYK